MAPRRKAFLHIGTHFHIFSETKHHDAFSQTSETASPKTKPYRLFDGHGLYLEVVPTGGKYWRFKYEFQAKERRLAFGKYPDISLANARLKRDEARQQLANGVDPWSSRQDKKRQAKIKSDTTFELVTREWHELSKGKWTEKYAGHVIHRMEKDIFPSLGKMPISHIKPLHVLDTIRVMEERGAGEMARRGLQNCQKVFQYAIITERIETNPAHYLTGVLRPFVHGHYKSIEVDEIPEFLKALRSCDARIFAQTRRAVELLMLTFVRTSELTEAKWEEINLDGKEWIIPAERMKMRRPHIVPLSMRAVELFIEQQKIKSNWGWVFPSIPDPKKPMSNNSILSGIKRLGYKNKMTGHGFRSLAMSTIKEKMGYRHEVIDRQLAHAPANKVDAAYDRAKFLDDRRKMMQEWADYLDKQGREANNPE